MMNTGVVVRVFAGVSALGAFVVVVLSGLAAQNPGSHVLMRAIVAMLVGYVIGTVLGMISEMVVREHIERYRAARPVPAVPSGATGTAASSIEATVESATPGP